MPDPTQPSLSPDASELMQRFLKMRIHFKMMVPENVAAFRNKVRESNLSGKGAGVIDADLFNNAGIVFARSDGPVSMGELSRGLNVPLSTATRIVDWLVKNRYAERSDDPDDRRVVRVELTRSGKETYHSIHAFIREKIERALGQFTADERATFLSLLNKVLTEFEKDI